MAGDDRYMRALVYMGNQRDRPLDDLDAVSLMGVQLTVNHSGVDIATGVVTFTKVVDDGQRMRIVIESGAVRCCHACGHGYGVGEATEGLLALNRVYVTAVDTLPDVKMYEDLPLWVRVCADPADCRRRAVARAASG